MAADPGLLMAALKLMVMGMGFVYLMLGVMVLAIKLLSWLVARPVEVTVPMASPHGATPIPPGHVAAIAAAIHHHQRLASSNSAASPQQEESK